MRWVFKNEERLLKLEPEVSQLRRRGAIALLPACSLSLLVCRWYPLFTITQELFHDKVHDCLVFAIFCAI